MYTINPGEFKHIIQIESLDSNNNNDDNIPGESWDIILKAKAKIVNISGKDFIKNQGSNLIVSKRFIIRFPKNIVIKRNDRLLYNGNYYRIEYPSNIQEENKYLEIVAELIT